MHKTHEITLLTKFSLLRPQSLLVSVIVLCSGSIGTALSQQLPEFIVPPETSSIREQARTAKKPLVDAALSALQRRFTNLTSTEQAILELEPDTPVAEGLVTVEFLIEGSAELARQSLQGLGLLNGSAAGNLVSGRFPLNLIDQASSLSFVKFVRLSRPITRKGAALSQADNAMRSNVARLNFNVDGTGVTIGILSDSYNQKGGESADIASGDLPPNVIVLDDSAGGVNSDEGRAMAQLIHDIAPGATLIFHTAFNGPADFAQGILDLDDAGAEIIVDDVGYYSVPYFQDGVISQAVDQVKANGTTYFSAAGNSANRSYEAPYSDSAQSTNNGPYPLTNLHTFTPNDPTDLLQEFQLPAGATLDLTIQWDEPFASAGGLGSASDIDALLFNDANVLVASSTDGNVSGDAVENLVFTNNTGNTANFALMIGVYSGPAPTRLKWIEHAEQFTAVNAFGAGSSTSYGHPNAAGAIGVGAAYYNNTPLFGVSPPVIESFSSHGGLAVLFDTAGNRLAAPDNRNKPDLVAPDGTDTTFFGADSDSNGFPNFFGTSAAAPHAAAVAALQLECDSSQTPSQIRNRQITSAIDMNSAGFDNISGAGLIDAYEAISLSCSPSITTTCQGIPVTWDLNTNIGNATSGIDVILGTPDDDVINALGGDDVVCGGNGEDLILGGPGSDWIFGEAGKDEIFGGAGDDTVSGGDGDDTLYGQGGDDVIDGNSGVDQIYGGAGADTIDTGTGATVGTIRFAAGGSGADIITGGPDADRIFGVGGNDIISGLGGDDDLRGGSNNDVISGGEGDDNILGQAGLDELSGNEGNDIIRGGLGNDQLFGGTGEDTLYGEANNDQLNGDQGDDFLLGGTGNDTMNGGADSDACNGQGDNDTALECEYLLSVP